MKRIIVNVFAVVCLFAVFACGGGGDGSPVTVVPTPVGQVLCPDGSSVSLDKTNTCPTVTPFASVTFANTDPHNMGSGLVIPFNGTLDVSSITSGKVVLRKGSVTGAPVSGTVALTGDGRMVSFVPKQFLAYGQEYVFDADVRDSVGRPVKVTISFKTIDMICTSVATWSTPAIFSSAYQNCVAPIGVQTQVSPTFNTLQDDTCVITAGIPLTAACRNYFDNGTVLLADTSVFVGGDPTMWMSYIGTDKLSDLVLLDVHDQAVPVPVGILSLPSPIVQWEIGNPSGLFIHTADGKDSLVTVGSDKKPVATCMVGCS